ncbi:MAG: hypothetical protein LBS43_00365 [Prevotellaceae bacterium]|jgi:hypothetical protein|nr:hypothetical protein [Prevotellaceae bacterium]
MKRFLLITVLFFATLATVEAAKLKNEIQGIWNVSKIETTDQSLNMLINNNDLSKLLVEFTKSGVVMISGKNFGSKYRVEGNKLILSEGMVKNMSKAEVKANVKSGNLSLNLPAALVKQIMLTVKDMYVKSGGEVFIAKMIENIAVTYSIEAVITLKRK